MSAKGMGDIDELLAEITNNKTKKSLSDTGEIDDILKSLGKGKGSVIVKSDEPKTLSVKATQPSTHAAKSADTLFESFFENNFKDIAQAEKSKETVESVQAPLASDLPKEASLAPVSKNSSKFLDAAFAQTFTQKQDPTTKADRKKAVKSEPVHATIISPEIISHEPVQSVRKVEQAPSAGSLRNKIISAARDAVFSTEEDEEYPELPKASASDSISSDDKKSSIEKAYEEFLGENNTSDFQKNGDEPTPEPEVPTVEFPAQGSKAIKPSAVVMRPENDNSKSIYDSIKRSQPILNSEVDDTFREFFGETVAISRSEIDEGLRKKPSKSVFSRFFTKTIDDEADDSGEDDELADEESYEEQELDETDDYNSPSDAPAVESTLASLRSTATLRVVATGLTSILLLYLGLSARTDLLPAIPVLNPTNEPLLYLVANLALLLISGLVCVSTIIGGFASIVKEPSGDVLTSVCFTGAFLQNLAYLISSENFDPVKVTLFAPVAAVSLCACAIGKRMQCTTVCRNFETVSVGYDHSAAFLLKNREIAAKVCRELEDDEPALLVSRHTSLVKNFLKQSFSQCKSAKIARILSFVILGVALIAFIFTYIQAKSFLSALSAFSAVCVLCAPFSASLLQAVPASLMQKSTARVGAIVPGWSAIEDLGVANAVLVNAKDLFPRECIRLHGIKTFEKERIDLAILYAASILVEGCDTLRDIFLGVIENKTEMLYKVDSLSVEPGLGFTAWVEHTRVIVGNRLIMQKHDIDLPSLDYELKYTKGERCPIYLAVSGKLFGMFLVSYAPSTEADEELYSLSRNGISIVVKSDDFNITGDMVAQLYRLNRSQVKVLNAQEREALAPQTAYLPESEGILTHLGTLSSFAGGIRAAAAAQSGLKLAGIVQIAAVALGILLCALLIMSKSLIAISLTAVILFQLAWTALTIIVPFTRRY